MIAGHASNATLMNRIMSEETPDALILNAGSRTGMEAIDEQS